MVAVVNNINKFLNLYNLYYFFVICIDRKNKTNPAVGDIVKVFSPFHQEMYRALIEGVKGNFYQVFYMDFGNLEQVQSRDIFELSDDLKKEVSFNNN